ncbi:ATP-binding cassette domain-containing protein [Agrobacterium rhizogenes]|uniref:ABC transporter ATP-binding protein n=1 Tax=Rhizobium rhizogenes TaxID=359 RepID=UPI00080FE6FE|nr:oligopeptide/dipeptide ABC transporter ATP-binding protein [Rhizobium rhizogenes]OCJ20632.1 peptide ABC transporter ATP-binding protein [Agrobacterium sp. B133/95]NTI50632.1 ATP-binding cassette domain-containing protein [Rhizobium rhizogenes]NTI96004.1 ATP-binding cassette domain-containing protein [Rhizobium rhizogenes]NTJ58474.1 ATP-binding cassette domain-containing protein [Rhizobium rhizogenes]QRM40171.1 ATP-binding cassette domain-containing protein [Rhizobium rhizogenes]
MNPAPLLDVQNLKKSYPLGRGGLFSKRTLKILHDVSFSVAPGEVLGLVGESGSGKSTIGRAILRLIESKSDVMRFNGQDLNTVSPARLRDLRKEMQIIFQDPYASLDPRKTIRAVLSEALDAHGLHKGPARVPRLIELVNLVGLDPSFLDRRPHEFSGGQRQRIGIARALAVEPSFIVCDEAVSALDVSIQAQVLNLLADLRAKTGVSLLFISHDLSVVRYISDRIMVLYLGRVMEVGPADQVHFTPKHPYTAALVSAEPSLHRESRRIRLIGEIPSPLSLPSGCVFRSRCPYVQPACAETVPTLQSVGDQHQSACLRHDIL